MFEGLFIQQYQKKFRKVPFPGLQCLLCGHFSIEILDPITHHIVVTYTLNVSCFMDQIVQFRSLQNTLIGYKVLEFKSVAYGSAKC